MRGELAGDLLQVVEAAPKVLRRARAIAGLEKLQKAAFRRFQRRKGGGDARRRPATGRRRGDMREGALQRVVVRRAGLEVARAEAMEAPEQQQRRGIEIEDAARIGSAPRRLSLAPIKNGLRGAGIVGNAVERVVPGDGLPDVPEKGRGSRARRAVPRHPPPRP